MADVTTRDATVVPKEPGFAAIGTTIAGRYKVEALLGTGGMGAVYLVQHTLMHKRFALKMLNAETSRLPEMVARFEREAIAAGRIDHPNIAGASDFGRADDGTSFLVLEYLEGQRLRDALAAGPIPFRRAIHIAMQVASALERTHELGIIHRGQFAVKSPSRNVNSDAFLEKLWKSYEGPLICRLSRDGAQQRAADFSGQAAQAFKELG